MKDGDRPLRVLVTGASGFVGSHVVRAALDRGHEVVAAVRSRAGAARLDGLSTSLRLVEADLCNAESMRQAASEAAPDMAVHLAWSIGRDYHDSPDNLTCVGGSLALLQGLLAARCPRIVFVGTHLELAPSAGDMNEDDPVAPRSLYAACKDAVHRVARAYVASTGTSFVWARLFNVYGPGQADWALVSYIITHLLAGRRCPLTPGDQQRAFLHVRDVAEALLDVGHSSVRGIVHVAADGVVSIRELAFRIGERLGRSELLSFGELAATIHDAPRLVSSRTRLYSEVGFRPRLSLDEGLADTIEWWQEHQPLGIAP